MSSVGLYGFEIPHDFATPTRDMVLLRIPFPPKKIGSIITPQQSRDMMAHNVMAGMVHALGPLAFQYKDVDPNNGSTVVKKQPVKVGDWVLIRPYAGTMVQGGQIMITSGWRYVSSFQDIIGILPSDKMPKADTLEWEAGEDIPADPKRLAQDDFNFQPAVRERATFKD